MPRWDLATARAVKRGAGRTGPRPGWAADRALHSRGAEGPACRARRRARRHARRDQGRVAGARPTPPPRPDRRRPGRRPARHAPDGGDQHRLRGAHPARGRRPRHPTATARRRGRHGARQRGRPARRRTPAAPEDAPGHRPGRHQRHGPPRNQTTTPPGLGIPLARPPAAAPRPVHAGPPRLAAVRARWSGTTWPATSGWSRRRSTRRSRPRCRSASSTATRWARSRRSSRATSTGWPGRSQREPHVALAARVIAAELDRRGIRRVHRPPRPGWQSSPFR